MTRVISGSARGRRLAVPEGTATRPTSDRAREGLFSSLLSLLDLEQARVLDLYAGSGALGLEALSRGAASATLVEDDPGAVAVPSGTASRRPRALPEITRVMAPSCRVRRRAAREGVGDRRVDPAVRVAVQ